MIWHTTPRIPDTPLPLHYYGVGVWVYTGAQSIRRAAILRGRITLVPRIGLESVTLVPRIVMTTVTLLPEE